MKKLRPYQQQAMDEINDFIANEKGEVVLEAPTSYGKSMIIAELAKKYKDVVVMTNITKLIYQTSDLFDELNIGHSLLKANLKKEPKIESDDVILAMQQTLASRKHLKPKCEVLVVDERHISFNSQTMKEIEARLCPEHIVGLSATPYTAEGYKLPNVKVVSTTDIKDLTNQGFLCPLDTYVAQFSEKIDLSEVDTKAGDYNEVQLAQILNTDAYNKEVVIQWEKIAKDKKTIVFASGVAHADALRDAFLSQGYDAGSVHSKQSDEKNTQVMDWFKRGEINILCSMNQLTTGFSEEDIEVGIICRPTKVRRLWTQCCGRVMRTHPNKERGIILDFGQVTKEFGLYDEPYDAPEFGDKDGLIVAKNKAKLDGIDIFMHENDVSIAKINRDDVTSTLQRIKSNALQSRDAKKLIMLFEASDDIDEILSLANSINDLKTGSKFDAKTHQWIANKWRAFIDASMYSEAKNIKAMKTRIKNIVRDGKNIKSIGYFCDWLFSQESIQQNKW